MPREIYNRKCHKERIDNIIEAMFRYTESDMPIPKEWLEELEFRIMKIQN